MNNQTTQVTETLFTATHPYLHKHVSVYQILVSSLFALGGVVAVVFALQSEESDSTFNMALLTLGVLLLLFAIYRFSWKSFETIYQPTGSAVKKGTLYMDTIELQRIEDMIKKKDFSDSFRSSPCSYNTYVCIHAA